MRRYIAGNDMFSLFLGKEGRKREEDGKEEEKLTQKKYYSFWIRESMSKEHGMQELSSGPFRK